MTPLPCHSAVAQSYTLDIPADGSAATITANTVYGAYMALQTLSQAIRFDFDSELYGVAAVPLVISDAPKFAWRGILSASSAAEERGTVLCPRQLPCAPPQSTLTATGSHCATSTAPLTRSDTPSSTSCTGTVSVGRAVHARLLAGPMQCDSRLNHTLSCSPAARSRRLAGVAAREHRVPWALDRRVEPARALHARGCLGRHRVRQRTRHPRRARVRHVSSRHCGVVCSRVNPLLRPPAAPATRRPCASRTPTCAARSPAAAGPTARAPPTRP